MGMPRTAAAAFCNETMTSRSRACCWSVFWLGRDSSACGLCQCGRTIENESVRSKKNTCVVINTIEKACGIVQGLTNLQPSLEHRSTQAHRMTGDDTKPANGPQRKFK